MPVIPAFSNSVASIDTNYYVDIAILSLAEAAAKSFTLSTTPTNADKVTLDLIGGVPQIRGLDFEVIGNTIDWNGLSLETVLTAGDKIRVIYII